MSLPSLSGSGVDSRRYIEVSSVRANLLHIYLWSNSVKTSVPMPHTSGVDRIELEESVDLDMVQRLLNQWA